MSTARLPGRRGAIDATVRVPGSKSVANRALVCAALCPAGSESSVVDVPAGDDCAAMLTVLRGCGAVDGTTVKGGLLPGTAGRFDAGIAGTTSRFLTAVAALSPEGVVVDGGGALRRRPMGDLHSALRTLGATVQPAEGTPEGFLPVHVSRGALVGGAVRVRGDVSSQFVSSLMLIGPVLPEGLSIDVEGELVSRPYVDMTSAVMRSFGANVETDGSRIRVEPSGYRACDYTVEPDFSAAAFPLLALAHGHGTVRIPNLSLARLQGDRRVLEIAQLLGIHVDAVGNDVIARRSKTEPLHSVSLDLRDASDLLPAVAVACAAVPAESSLTGVGFVRAKESDRISDLAKGLRALGADVREQGDGLVIRGTATVSCRGVLETSEDHRLAMAFSLPAAGGVAVELDDAAVVSKSWPGYFGEMEAVLGPVVAAN